MLLTVSLAAALVLSAEPAGAPPPACEPAFTARLASLQPVFTSTAGFRKAAGEGKASFTDLVKQGSQLRKLAEKDLEQIQDKACDLPLEDTKRFDACVAPIQWSCEAIPPGIDWSLLKGVTKNEDEASAYALTLPENGGGVDLLSDSASFAGGCGDFGCAEKSVALPALLAEPKRVEQWVTLATRPGFFGERALQRLESLGSTLAKATCEGGGWRPASAKERKAVIAHLDAQRTGLTGEDAQTKRVGKALQRLAAGLKRGPPKKACEMPGSGD